MPRIERGERPIPFEEYLPKAAAAMILGRELKAEDFPAEPVAHEVRINPVTPTTNNVNK